MRRIRSVAVKNIVHADANIMKTSRILCNIEGEVPVCRVDPLCAVRCEAGNVFAASENRRLSGGWIAKYVCFVAADIQLAIAQDGDLICKAERFVPVVGHQDDRFSEIARDFSELALQAKAQMRVEGRKWLVQ